jgi:hypothetical protein
MALQSMTALASITLQDTGSTVTFSGIPQNYRDLVLAINGSFSTNSGISIRYNSDTGTNYSNLWMGHNSNTPASATELASTFYGTWSMVLNNTRYTQLFQVMDYSESNKHKTALWRSNYTDSGSDRRVEALAGRWANTSPITALTLSCNGFIAGSTINLYGRIA